MRAAKGDRGRAALAAAFAGAVLAAVLVSPAAADHSFCPQGSGAQQCERAAGAAVDAASGDVYIADETGDRIQVFDEDGAYLRTIGGPGVLERPRELSVDNDIGGGGSATQGEVFVIDGVNKPRVLRFTPAGELRLGFGWGVADGSAELQTCGPEATPPTASCLEGLAEAKDECRLTRRSHIGVAPGGRVFVADSARFGPSESEGFVNRLMKFAADGASCEEAPVFPAPSPKELNAIAVDGEEDSYLAVAREELEIRKVAADGSGMCFLDRSATTLPVGTLAIDPASGRLYAGRGESKARAGGSYAMVTIYEPGCSGEAVEIERRFGYAEIGNTIRGLAPLPGVLDPERAGEPVVSEGFGATFNVFHLPLPAPGPILVPGSATAEAGNTQATLGIEANAEGAQTEVTIEFVEEATCTAEEAGGGECFDSAEPSEPVTLGSEGFALQGAEVQFGCPDPLSEAGHPGESAYEAGECLEPETAYRFRAIGSNLDGEGNSPLDGGTFQTSPWIEFGPAWASEVGTGSAQLNAELNPLGVPVTARFQLVTEEEFKASGFAGAIEAPAPGEDPLDFGAGEAPLTRSVSLGGLEAGRSYRYRLVASNPLAADLDDGQEARAFTVFAPPPKLDCPANEAFRTGPGALLPDCRGYELVSPLDKGNGDIVVLAASVVNAPAVLERSSTDGGRFAYGSLKAFPDAPSAPWTSHYLARRVADVDGEWDEEEGWQSHAISSQFERPIFSSAPEQAQSEVKALSPDLCSAWVRTISEPVLAPGAQEGLPNLYRRGDEDCGERDYEALSTSEWQSLGGVSPKTLKLELQGISTDGKSAAFVSPYTLAGSGGAPDLGGDQLQLYLWAGGPRPVFACFLPGGAAPAEPCSAGRGPGAQTGEGLFSRLQGALSADGRRLFWSTGAGDGKLYLRQDPALGKTAGECALAGRPCTIAVSAPGEAISGTAAAQFRAAAEDGSAAVYTTDAAGAGEDLYLARIGAGGSEEPTLEETVPVAEHVIGVMGVSEDASHVYFASTDQIIGAGANSEGDEASEGKPNLYLYRDGAYAFIGTLSAQETDPTRAGPLAAAPVNRMARVSGAHAAFVSGAPLTGADNADVASRRPDTQVFLYDAEAGELSCASCNPSGARPAGRANSGSEKVIDNGPAWVAGWIAGHQSSLYASRELSEGGGRLFFNSTDSLVARDTNSRADVYQWEAPGTGSCTVDSPAYSPRNEGCVELISSGQSAQDSEFAEASPSGSDVFFTTLSNLVPADYDLVDVYDARIGGGFPPPPAPRSECEGEACANPPPPPPPPNPASAGYPGSDDVPLDRCAAPARRAGNLARGARKARARAKALRRRAARGPALARRARRAARAARQRSGRAQRLAKQAQRCRRAQRRAQR